MTMVEKWMSGRAGAILAALVVVVALPGLWRLEFDTDVTGVLPGDLPEVRGLRVMQREFSRDSELVVLLEAGDADDAWLLEELAGGLAEHLVATGHAASSQWRPAWEDAADDADGAETAAMIAWLWLNGPTENVAAWQATFAADAAAAALDEALAAVATAPEGLEMVLRANDPFGFLRHPSLDFLNAAGDSGGFESDDGLARVIVLESPTGVAGHRAAEAWVEAVRASAGAWLAENNDGADMRLRITGGPAFAAEIGGAMERDMRGTALATLLLVSALFWWMQRRLRLLAGLVVMLGLVFATTLGVAGWLPGGLSVMTAGFAAILIGLAVDYGVLMCQEAKRLPGDVAALRRATTGSVVWASLTTAAVFAALNFSGLPGIAALGTLVAVGFVAGALLMLAIYLPFVARSGAGRRAPSDGGWPGPAGFRPAWLTGAALAAAAGMLLVWCGFPVASFDPRLMRPRESAAMEAFERVQQGFAVAREPDARWVVEIAADEPVAARLDELASRAAEHPLVASARIPHGWWPDAARQAENRGALGGIAARADALLESAAAAGFSDEGLALARAVFARFASMTTATPADPSPAMPDGASFAMLTRGFLSQHPDGGGALMIDLDFVADADATGGGHVMVRKLNDARAHVTGWELLRPALAPLVADDVRRVFLPMLVVMLVMLAIAFRNLRDVIAVVAAMALAGWLTLAAMAVLGIGWNILNIAAAPLFLGIGIDYGIHMTTALRRHRGNVHEAWHGTGKAVMFCAASTGIGFGSLCFASNEALASLGAVSVVGIACAMATSVFLLPGWRRGGVKPPQAPAAVLR
jgi:predicted exporter